MKSRLSYFALVVAAATGLVLSAVANPPTRPADPPDPPDAPDDVSIGYEARKAADDYLEAIEELEHILGSYAAYFSELDREMVEEYGLTFEQFSKGIEQGTYAREPQRLANDIRDLTEHLRSLERQLRSSDTRDDRKLYRQIKGFRRELKAVRALLEEDIVPGLDEQKENSERIQQYLEHEIALADYQMGRHYEELQKLKELEILSDRGRMEDLERKYILWPDGSQRLLGSEALAELEELDLEELEKLPELIGFDAQKLADAIDQLEIHVTDDGGVYMLAPHSDPPRILFFSPSGDLVRIPYPRTESPKISDKGKGGDWYAGEWADTLRVRDKHSPIYISHPLGTVDIKGWEGDLIAAELKVNVSGGSDDSREEFTDGTSLRLSERRSSYMVETAFPELSDTRINIGSSVLELYVPAECELICDNSFGDIRIADIRSGVMVKGYYSGVDISDVKGQVRIENTMGKVLLSDIVGEIDLINSYGPVAVADCRGELTIENTGHSITVSDSRGRLTLVNSGPVKVVEHAGPVDIENSNGPVTVRNLTGDLVAFNSYQPLMVEHVIGSAKLENTNALIQVAAISMELQARNKYGDIIAESLAGPVELYNDDGQIALVLDNNYRGPSTVTSSSGGVELIVPEDMDILLQIDSDDGDITTDFPLTESSQGRSQMKQIVRGDGSERLLVTTKRSPINITRAD